MSAEALMITEAVITSPGDPYSGIPDHQMVLSHLNMDLGVYAEEDQPVVIENLRLHLRKLGAFVSGEDSKRVQVFLVGHDDPQPEE